MDPETAVTCTYDHFNQVIFAVCRWFNSVLWESTEGNFLLATITTIHPQ